MERCGLDGLKRRGFREGLVWEKGTLAVMKGTPGQWRGPGMQ